MIRGVMNNPRNEKCPCGSGKKFKKCCGSPQAVAKVSFREKMDIKENIDFYKKAFSAFSEDVATKDFTDEEKMTFFFCAGASLATNNLESIPFLLTTLQYTLMPKERAKMPKEVIDRLEEKTRTKEGEVFTMAMRIVHDKMMEKYKEHTDKILEMFVSPTVFSFSHGYAHATELSSDISPEQAGMLAITMKHILNDTLPNSHIMSDNSRKSAIEYQQKCIDQLVGGGKKFYEYILQKSLVDNRFKMYPDDSISFNSAMRITKDGKVLST